MPIEITLPQMAEAINHLKDSPRGRKALVDLDSFLDNGLLLDNFNRHAVMTLLGGVWGAWAGTGSAVIKDAANEIRS